MAHQAEPVDIDCINSDFDNKENTFNHNNALPCTEKGYEELDVSELNMKLRYSFTPTNSPMSKSFTNCTDNKSIDSDDSFNYTLNESNLTRSLNSTMTKNDNVIKSLKTLPLQTISTDQKIDKDILVSSISQCNDINVTITGTSDIDDVSLSSTTSSVLHTPEATTPTKENPKTDSGSPILRGLKSVLNMFRSSQSPITPADTIPVVDKQETLTPVDTFQTKSANNSDFKPETMASTPIATPRLKERNGSQRSSPYKESIVFNDDLEKELQWKDETTIIFSHEKIPVHKLFFQQLKAIPTKSDVNKETDCVENKIHDNLNSTVGITDVPYNKPIMGDKTMTDIQEDTIKNENSVCNDSDSEFLDCETTFIKDETITIDNVKEEFKTENNSGELGSDLENNKTFNYNHDCLVCEVEGVATALPVESVQNAEYDKSLQVMVDSLDVNVNEKLFLTELKPEDNLMEEKIILPLDNERSINEQNILISKNNFENSISTEYELDSLEYNVMIKANDIDTIHNNENLVTARINKLPTQEMKSDDEKNLVNCKTTSLPIEIPLPAEDDNELELNIIERTQKERISNDLLDQTIEASTEVQGSIDETVDIKVISNVSLTKTEREDQNFIKNEEIIETLNTEIVYRQEEIDTIRIQSEEIVNSSLENNNVNMTQSLLENKGQLCSEFLDNLDTSRSCENKITLNYSMDQCTSLNSLYENCMKLQNESLAIDHMAVESQSDQITENKTELKLCNLNEEIVLQGTMTVLETKENLMDDKQVPSNLFDNYKGAGDISSEIIENNKTVHYNQDHLDCEVDVLVTALSVESPQNTECDKSLPVMIDSLDVNVNENMFLTELKTEDILKEDKIILPLDNERNTIIGEESDVKFDIENKEQVLEENMSFQLNNTKEMEEIEIIEDTNNKLLSAEMNKQVGDGQEINDKDREGVSQIFNSMNTEAVQNIETNDSNEINLVCRHNESPDTFSDNTVVEKSADVQDNTENSLNVLVTNYHNVTVEQVSGAASNEQKLDNIIQNESKYTNATHSNELPVNEIITSDINLHTDNTEDLEMTTSIKENVADYSYSQTINEKNHINSVIKKKSNSINSDTQQIKEISIDRNLTVYTDPLDKDNNISELDTFTLEEEILLSENNSPYVSVAGDLDKLDMDQNPETFLQTVDANTTIIISSSPPIISKGYNFNFDETENPFSTKTNYQTSPTSEKVDHNIESTVNNMNVDQTQMPKKILANERRKTQCERRKQFISSKKHNKTFSSDSPVPEADTNTIDHEYTAKNIANTESPMKSIDSNTDDILTTNNDKTLFVTRDFDTNNALDDPDVTFSNRTMLNEKYSNIINPSEVNELSIESTNIDSPTDHNNVLSSHQSSYYPVDTVPSNESIKSRNVFNLPEIDDINFNPFAVKSKLSQSPLPNCDEDNPFITRSKLSAFPENAMISCKYIEAQNIESMDKLVDKNCEDKMETEPMEKGASVNKSSDTCSSNTSVKDITVREIENGGSINRSSDTCLSDASEKDTVVGEINTEDEDTVEGPFLDDLNNDEMSCFDGDNIDMMKLNDIANQESEENAEGELFIDAEAFQFLLNKNRSNVVTDSGKESLFLKFDPLFAKRLSSDSVITALSKIQNRQSTPVKTPIHQNIMSASTSLSTSNMICDRDNTNTMEVNNDNLNVTVSKPMMVVPPAVNAIATPRKSQTPTRMNRHSATFTSPAMAVIDRLLSLSANNSLVEHESSFTQASREQNEANLALTQLRELLAEKEIHVYNLRSESKDLKDRLIVLESHMNTLETESQQRLMRIEELTETLSKKTNMDRNMAVVFEEYESTIANLIAQIEKDKKQHAEERAALINERNEQTAHLTNMEVSFNDLHSKYEKIKQVISNYRANEESYKKSLKTYEENFIKAQNNYELLKQHATSKLNSANEELQKIKKAHEAEVLKMNAMIKRKDLHITSLEETLAQKTKANEELTAICDELINKVG